MHAFEHAVTLHEVHALEGHVEPRILGVAQQHELAAMPIRLDLTKSFELPDAVIHVHDKVARLEFRKIAEKTRSANLAAGTLDRGGNVEKVSMTVNREIRFRKSNAFRKRRTNQEEPSRLLRALSCKSRCRFFRFAKDVRNLVLAANVR